MPERFHAFADIPGLRLFSLRNGPPAPAIEHLHPIIMIDPSVAHLAGSLGTPIWNFPPYVPHWHCGMGGARTP